METIWFVIVTLMIVAYAVLDGFDIGVGILHWLVAKNDGERRTVFEAIGPFWNGNEVWLIAAGGTLYFAFPALYAASFSGFYLPLMIVLWLLMLRASRSSSAATSTAPRGHPSGTSSSRSRACSSSSSTPRRSGTWCAACRSQRRGGSSHRSGPTCGSARR